LTDPFSDPRFEAGVIFFNGGDWYASHDLFEELWQETNEPERRWLQGIVQIAVARLHGERGNSHGAMVLLGEGLGRLRTAAAPPAHWQAQPLIQPCQQRLSALQRGENNPAEPLPQLIFSKPEDG
jgi:predicted metal-dependent hydrolase